MSLNKLIIEKFDIAVQQHESGTEAVNWWMLANPEHGLTSLLKYGISSCDVVPSGFCRSCSLAGECEAIEHELDKY